MKQHLEEERSAAPQAPARSHGNLAWILAWLCMLPAALSRAGHLTESDTFWQIRTGALTLQSGAIPTTDPFSWTAVGEPWTQNSWAFNVLLAIAHEWWNLAGVGVLTAVLIMSIAALVLVLGQRLGARPALLGLGMFLVSPLLIGYLQARPQLIDYLAVLALTILLSAIVRDQIDKRVAVVLSFALSLTWVNMHAATLLALAILGGCAALLFLRPAGRPYAWWVSVAFLASAAGAAINPRGVLLLSQTVNVRDASADLIIEWQRLDLSDIDQFLIFAIGLCALAVAVRRRDTPMISALAVTAAGSIVAMRMLPMLLLLALPVLAGVRLPRFVGRYVSSRETMLSRMWVLFVVAACVTIGLPNLTHLGQPAPSIYSASVVDQIPTGCRVFNSYVLGGHILLERPDVLVSIDSRNDLYGIDRVRSNELAVRGEIDPTPLLQDAGCVVLNTDQHLADSLSANDKWELRASDDVAVLFVRR